MHDPQPLEVCFEREYPRPSRIDRGAKITKIDPERTGVGCSRVRLSWQRPASSYMDMQEKPPLVVLSKSRNHGIEYEPETAPMHVTGFRSPL